MKTLLSIVICICFFGLVADCDNFTTLVVSKLTCVVVMSVCFRLFTRFCLTDDERNSDEV